LDAAKDYLGRGWKPVPVPPGQKGPKDTDWPSKRITVDNVETIFVDPDGNIAIQLGEASGGVTDVDLDCAEAVSLANFFLPETPAVFGRKSKPSSHRIYISDLSRTESKGVLQFREPKLESSAEPQHGPMLVELRIGGGGKGVITLFPPSMNPSGEAVAWNSEFEQPSVVDGDDLSRRVHILAAAKSRN
jgi:hypothetical protein